jgi:hypothetical protein
MPDPSGFTWHPGVRRYKDGRGRFVARRDVRAALDRVIDAAAEDMRRAALDLQAGRINLPEWQIRMEAGLRAIHTASGAIAKGGWARATAADWSAVAARLRAQYGYLRDFAYQVENGLPLDGRFLDRCAMYAASATGTYEAIHRRDMVAAGAREERRALHAEESCKSCVAYAALGWQPAGSLPGIGEQSECLSRCRCSFRYRDRKGVEMGTVAIAVPGPDLFEAPEVEFSDPPRMIDAYGQRVSPEFAEALLDFLDHGLGPPEEAGFAAKVKKAASSAVSRVKGVVAPGLGNCGTGAGGFKPGNTCGKQHSRHGTGRGGTKAHRKALHEKLKALRAKAKTPAERKALAHAVRDLNAYRRGEPHVGVAHAARIRRQIHEGKVPKATPNSGPRGRWEPRPEAEFLKRDGCGSMGA